MCACLLQLLSSLLLLYSRRSNVYGRTRTLCEDPFVVRVSERSEKSRAKGFGDLRPDAIDSTKTRFSEEPLCVYFVLELRTLTRGKSSNGIDEKRWTYTYRIIVFRKPYRFMYYPYGFLRTDQIPNELFITDPRALNFVREQLILI